MQPNKPPVTSKRPDSKGKDEPTKRVASSLGAAEKRPTLGKQPATNNGKDSASNSNDNLKDLLITNVMSGLTILDSTSKRVPSKEELRSTAETRKSISDIRDLGAKKNSSEAKPISRADSLTQAKPGLNKKPSVENHDSKLEGLRNYSKPLENTEDKTLEIKTQDDEEINFDKFLPSENRLKNLFFLKKKKKI